MDPWTRHFVDALHKALRARYGRESDAGSCSDSPDPTPSVQDGAAAHPDLDSSPDCPQCHLPWVFHPINEESKEFECTEFQLLPAKRWNRDD